MIPLFQAAKAGRSGPWWRQPTRAVTEDVATKSLYCTEKGAGVVVKHHLRFKSRDVFNLSQLSWLVLVANQYMVSTGRNCAHLETLGMLNDGYFSVLQTVLFYFNVRILASVTPSHR